MMVINGEDIMGNRFTTGRYNRMIFLLLLVTSIQSTTRLSLHSRDSTSKLIPVIKHEFSCELVYFKVNDYSINVTVKDIPLGATARITFEFEEGVENQQVNVSNAYALFQMNFSNRSDIPKGECSEQNIKFNLTVMDKGKQILTQRRKTYFIFLTNQKEIIEKYHVKLPRVAIIITQIAGLICTLLLPLNVRYRRFLPITLNMISGFAYIAILFIALYLQMIFPSNAEVYLFQRLVVGIFSVICLFLYSQDLLCFCIDNKAAPIVLAAIFSGGIIFCDQFLDQLEDAWFLNNVIAIMIAGAFIKFVIIRQLNSAMWALGLIWLFFILRQFAIEIGWQEYDQGVGIRIVPLFLQIPKISMLLDEKVAYACSAFGSSKIISFGVLLNYSKRIDLYLSTHFYRIMCYILISFCIVFELFFNLLHDDIPTMEVMSVIIFYPLSISLMLFFANKRGEWAEVWHGSFYDMAVNRASIPRNVSFEQISESFGEDLFINKGSDVE